jgi:hypothetical protein
MKEVEIRALDDSARDVRVGTIRWDGTCITLDPADNPCLLGILKAPVRQLRTGRVLTARDAPEEWLAALQFQYRSAYLRAMAPQET